MNRFLIAIGALVVFAQATCVAALPPPTPDSGATYALALEHRGPRPETVRATITLSRIDPPLGPVDRIIDLLVDVRDAALRNAPSVEIGMHPHDPHGSRLTMKGSLSPPPRPPSAAAGEVMRPPPPPRHRQERGGPPPPPPPPGDMQARLHVVATFRGHTLVRASGELRDSRSNRVMDTWTVDLK